MKNIINRISNLLTIKSIVTLILTICFALLAMNGFISAEVFITVYSTIIGFYFGTQKSKDTETDDKTDIEDN